MKPEAIGLSVKSGDTYMENLTLEKDVVEEFKVSRSTLWKWRKSGLPHVRIGRKIFYKIDALVEWWRIKQEEQSNESHN